MQKVTVHLFSGIQAMVGGRSIDLDLPDHATVDVLRERLVAEYPVLEAFMSTFVVAVDEEVVPGAYPLAPGQRIELIPPIAGG